MTVRSVVVLDHGFGNVRSAAGALAHVGADVDITGDPERAAGADGLYVPGVGAFAAVVEGIRATGGDKAIISRVETGRPVLAVCVGLQAMFESSDEEGGGDREGLGLWPGTVARLPGGPAARVPHMGWNTVEPPAGSVLFEGLAGERFYFVHSYAATEVRGRDDGRTPSVTWAEHGVRFVAAVEDGPLTATQFHPEKSGDAGLHLLDTWLRGLG